MKTIILFLDIDGVLNTVMDPNPSHPDDDFNPVLMDRLNRLLKALPNCKVVITSDWLIGDSWENVRNHMVRNGFLFGGQVIGQIKKDFGSRFHNITNWLDEPEGLGSDGIDDNVSDDFIILDDKDPGYPKGNTFANLKQKHFFQPDEKIGLTEDMMQDIIRKLK